MYTRISSLMMFVALIFPTMSHAEIMQARIISVVDGDTIKILDDNNIKYVVSLSGIDAPEITQANGKASKNYLCKLICDKDVVLSYNKLNTRGHPLSTVYLDKANINLIMLEKGMAW